MHPHDRFATTAACYVHLPFCARVCPYCDFAVVEGRDDMIPRYMSAVRSEIELDHPWRPLEAVFFGGGTPSHLPPAALEEVLALLNDRHGLASDSEITMEANPEDFSPLRAAGFRAAGFNRVSFGAQSFDDDVLGYLGRRHRAPQIRKAVEAARDQGFMNVSIDLIFGSPDETDASWSATLESAIQLGADHISCYSLTVERGTPLGRAVDHGAAAPDPDIQADRYECAEQVLGAAGYSRYEVSNWARDGMECRYNLTVWAQGEYLAYGNGAHGYRHGRRFRNVRRLDAYIDTLGSGRSPRAGEDVIEGWEGEIDRLFVGLRRTSGVAHGPGTSVLMADPDGLRLLEAGVLEDTGDRLIVRRPLLTDAVHRAVLGLRPTVVAPPAIHSPSSEHPGAVTL